MRLLDTTTFQFVEVSDSDLAESKRDYAILSHRWTWGDDEILFADVQLMDSTVKAKKGYPKFTGACELAKKLDYDLLWIDTCCINKSDSVELGEAINSMYRWYGLAKLCIAYLEDVTSSDQIGESVWFSRGWTLQELIAPKSVEFYDKSWSCYGDKSSLGSKIVRATGIPSEVLQNKKPPQAFSVAQRMSWAAKRTTKRPEDRAYSLMGLFDVNMPMIYGEQDKAFIRLQEQIIAKFADETIFAWSLDLPEDSTRDPNGDYYGPLATSPASFARCGSVACAGRSRGFYINQFGVVIKLPAKLRSLGTWEASLRATGPDATGNCALLLSELPEKGFFARASGVSRESVVTINKTASKVREFQIPLEPTGTPFDLYHGLWLRRLEIHGAHISKHTVFRRYDERDEDRLKLPDGEWGTAGIIQFRVQYKRAAAASGYIKLGFGPDCRPICFVTSPNQNYPMSDSARSLEKDVKDLLHVRRLYGHQQSSKISHHQIFDDTWLYIDPEFGSYLYDSRRSNNDDSESGFGFSISTRLFKLSASATIVPDVNPNSKRKGHVWAVDVTTGPPPTVTTGPPPTVTTRSGGDDCDDCCC